MQTPSQFCESITLKSKSNFLIAFKFLSKEQKRAMYALYAFCRTIDDWVDEESQQAYAQERLSQARDCIEHFPCLEPHQPIFYELSWATTHFQLNSSYFLALLDGMQMDLNKHSYAHFEHLEKYCFNVASSVGLLLAQIFHPDSKISPTTEHYAYDLGIALQLTNILRDLQEDANRNRIYIPMDYLQQEQVLPCDFLNFHTLSDQVFSNILLPIVQKTRAFYESANAHFQQLLPNEQKKQRTGLMMGALYYAIFQKIEQNFQKNSVLTVDFFQKKCSLPLWDKLSIALRAYYLRKIL